MRRSTPELRDADVGHKSLVTGAAGFVGAGMTRRLLAEGHDLTACVAPGSDHWRIADLADDLTIVEVDLRDCEGVRQTFAGARPEWVFHLGVHGGYSWQAERRRIFATNLQGTINVLEAAGEVEAAQVLCAGSSSEYGAKDHAPSERELLEPNSDYAVAKAAATLFATFLGREQGLPVATLRLYSVFGPFEQPGRFVPALIVHGLQGELPALVAGGVARDFVYLDDVVEAFLRAARTGIEPGAVLNVGSGVETSVAAAAESARRVFGLQAEPAFGSMPSRVWDTHRWVADPSLINSLLGWIPTVSFERGLAETADWLRTRPDLWLRYGLDAARLAR